MEESLNVLCLGADATGMREALRVLRELPGFAVTAREIDYQAGVVDLQTVGEPHLALVLLGRDALPGLAVLEEVHRTLPGTRVLAVAPEEHPETIVQAMRAGADEFLPQPLDRTALLKVCIKVTALRGATNGKPHGEVWVVHGPKGGIGVATLVA